MDSWELWNSFRLICEHHSQLCLVLDILWVTMIGFIFIIWPDLWVKTNSFSNDWFYSRSTLPSANSIGRWFGEPVRAAIIHTDVSMPWGSIYCYFLFRRAKFQPHHPIRLKLFFRFYLVLVQIIPCFPGFLMYYLFQSFLKNARGYPCLSKRHQKLITGFFNHSVQVWEPGAILFDFYVIWGFFF